MTESGQIESELKNVLSRPTETMNTHTLTLTPNCKTDDKTEIKSINLSGTLLLH